VRGYLARACCIRIDMDCHDLSAISQMFVRMSQAQGKMNLELLPTFTALDRSDMTKRRAPSAPSLPQPPCFAPNVRGAHLDGKWTFRKGELPPYVMKLPLVRDVAVARSRRGPLLWVSASAT